MSQPKGLWIAVDDELAGPVSQSIRHRGQFTTTVVSAEVRPRTAEIAVVSLGELAADFIGISRVGRRVATGQITVVVTHLVPLKRVTAELLRTILPRRFARTFRPPASGIYRPTPKLWEQILTALAHKKPRIRIRIRDLFNVLRDFRDTAGRVEGGLEVFERDAVASALEIWRSTGFRKRMLRSVVPTNDSSVPPFLTQIRGTSVREDPQIAHDQTTFPGMEIARKYQVGALTLRDRGEYLTIINCNRQPLEETLGVDLIYYSHRFDSFILVQYKRMRRTEKGAVYRPNSDRSHREELRRMVRADKLLKAVPKSDADSDTTAFRLSRAAFYVKLCESRIKSALDAGMVSGIYIPLGLWKPLLKSKSVIGARSGIGITWENCGRRFNNVEFTNLLRHGWIGSAAGGSKVLSKIIYSVLASKRMLVLAATSPAKPTRDLRRDSLGRFAQEDDPDSAF